MITKNKNKKNLTIDLKWIMAQEYLENNQTTMNKIINWILLSLYFIWISAVLLLTSLIVNAEDKKDIFLEKFWEKIEVIWCYNDITWITRKATKCYNRWDK